MNDNLYSRLSADLVCGWCGDNPGDEVSGLVDDARVRLAELEAKNAALRKALLLAIGVGLDLGLTEMEVDSVLMRAGADSLAALARQTEGEG